MKHIHATHSCTRYVLLTATVTPVIIKHTPKTKANGRTLTPDLIGETPLQA